MAGWLIKKHVPYEGISEWPCGSAKEVMEYLSTQSGLDMDDITIEPEPVASYSSYEFVEAFENGKVV